MRTYRIILLGFMLFSTSALAGTVKQLLNSQDLAIVEIAKNEKIEVGQSFLATNETSQCLVEILSLDKNLATVSTKNCEDKTLLVVGKKIEKSLFDNSLLTKNNIPSEIPKTEEVLQTPEKAEPKSNKISSEQDYIALKISYILNPKIKIEGTAFSGTSSENGTFDYEFDNTINLGFEWSQFANNTWNHGVLIDYTSLKFNRTTITGSSSGTSVVTVSGGMTVLGISYIGKYRGDEFYLPVTLGITNSYVDNSAAFTKTIATKALFGIGFGIAVNNNVNLELTSNATTVTSSSVTSSGTTIVPELGYFNYLQLGLKILFR